MRDVDSVRFLQEVLPTLGLRWAGYRKVRRQVRKRLTRRLRTLGLPDLEAYRDYLATHPEEREVFDAMCLIPISRFYRDRGVWDLLRSSILPVLASAVLDGGKSELQCWSVGCASGEEPYTLALCWNFDVADRFPELSISILATDAGPHLIARARTACYAAGSLKDLPTAWLPRAFDTRSGLFCLRPEMRTGVAFAGQDMRREAPDGPFDLILCRNAAFTYFDIEGQRELAKRLVQGLRQGGVLVLGKHEALPGEVNGLKHPDTTIPMYRALVSRNRSS